MIYWLAVCLSPSPTACSTWLHLHIIFPMGQKRAAEGTKSGSSWISSYCQQPHIIEEKVSDTWWEPCPGSHQGSQQQHGTEVPRFGKTHPATSTFGCSQARDQQEGSARRIGSHSPRNDGQSKTWFLFFHGEYSFLKLSIIFSLTPSREQTVRLASDSQILNPFFLLLVTHESDSFTSR